jgi:pyruvate dehydrogenase E2 component (dihydrolipoamide acetyltransferase)
MSEFKLPDVGEGIHEAVITQWLVKIGDTVALDQPLVEIETDKALVQIPSPRAGTIAQLPLAQGSTAQVGDVLVVFAGSDDAAGSGKKTSASSPAPREKPKTTDTQASITPGIAGPGQRILAAPAVRKRALQLGVDLRQVGGSAAGGRVTMDDLEKFMAQPRTAEAPAVAVAPTAVARAAPAETSTPADVIEPLQGLRRRIAERMHEAWQIPHVTSFAEVDAKKLVKLRRSGNQLLQHNGDEERLSYLPFIIKAVLQALQRYPYFNARLDLPGQRIIQHRDYHIGIATAIDEGLVVPVIRHAERLSTLELQRELNRLAERARSRRLTLAELSGSTFTITNYGSFRGQSGTPIINPPESAILGCGLIEDKALALNGKLKLRPVLPLALSFDHRLHDGAGAARFLELIKLLLSDPQRLYLYS